MTASQYDIDGEAVWSQVMDQAKTINAGLGGFLGDCAVPDSKLLEAGIGPNPLKMWRDQCHNARNAQTQFDTVFGDMLNQSMNVQYCREQHKRERQALVKESLRLE